jgi:hypothetical protein
MRIRAFQAVCIAAIVSILMVTAGKAHGFTLITEPQTFTITATPTDNLTNVHFLYHATTGGGDSYVVDNTLANMSANVLSTQMVTILVPLSPTDQTYSIAGTYDAANDVTIGVNSATAAFALGPPAQTWDQTFVNAPRNYTAVTEAAAGTALSTNDHTTLDQLFGDIQSPTAVSVGTSTNLINFSTATNGGTALALEVPEPMSFALLVPFFGAIVGSRYFRRLGFT